MCSHLPTGTWDKKESHLYQTHYVNYKCTIKIIGDLILVWCSFFQMKRREKVNGTLSPRSQARDQGWSIQPQLPPLQCQPPAPSLQSYQPWEISPKSQSPDSVLSHKQYQFMIEWYHRMRCQIKMLCCAEWILIPHHFSNFINEFWNFR